MEVDAPLGALVVEPVGSEAEPGIGPRAADGEEGSPPLPAPPAPSVPHDPVFPRTSSPQLESLPITALIASVERFVKQNVGKTSFGLCLVREDSHGGLEVLMVSDNRDGDDGEADFPKTRAMPDEPPSVTAERSLKWKGGWLPTYTMLSAFEEKNYAINKGQYYKQVVFSSLSRITSEPPTLIGTRNMKGVVTRMIHTRGAISGLVGLAKRRFAPGPSGSAGAPPG